MVFTREEPPDRGSPACDLARTQSRTMHRTSGDTSRAPGPAAEPQRDVWRGRVGHRPPRPTPDEEGFRVANRSEPAATPARTRNKKAEDRLENEKRFEVYGRGAPT